MSELEDLRAQLQASQETEARLRGLLSMTAAREDAEERLRDDYEKQGKQLALLRSQHSQLVERGKVRDDEHAESEREVEMLETENERLRQQLAEAKQAVQQLALLNQKQQHQHQQQQQTTTSGPAETSSFRTVSKEQLRQELLQAALAAEKLEQRVLALEETNEKLERTVQGLWRQNQELVDEMQTMRSSEGEAALGANDSMNVSLADELMLEATPPSTPVKQQQQQAVLFAELTVVAPGNDNNNNNNNAAAAAAASSTEAAPTRLFSDMQLKDRSDKERDDRQYRDYVFMSLSAIKIAMAIKELASAEMLLKLSAKKVYQKALERRVPLHQVHDFVRKYTVAYVEHMSAPKEKPKPPQQMGFLGRVLTTYFPSTDYLFRAQEVVPNRGSELGSFLWKKGSLLSRSWKQRWFKLNSQLGVVSYHPTPHELNSLGTITIAEIATVAAVPGGQPPHDHVFRITMQWGREYDLAADSVTIMNYWLDGLSEAIAARHVENADKRNSVNVL
jgi:hypothetical protein